MNNSDIKLIPYLNFQGNCEEALNTYKEIFEGKVEIINRYDNPAMNVTEEYKNKILHARFYFDENTIYASDIFPGKPVKEGRDVAMSLSLSDASRAQEIFDRLADGGKVRIPFKKQFWGDWHGNLTDRFGIFWMVNCEG